MSVFTQCQGPTIEINYRFLKIGSPGRKICTASMSKEKDTGMPPLDF
jgi:hypothetical protein